jgi:hypothetical protein
VHSKVAAAAIRFDDEATVQSATRRDGDSRATPGDALR